MYNFFKKKQFELNLLNEIEESFITTIINKLSTKYPLFLKELDLKIFISVSPNPGGSKGSFTYKFNADNWKKIADSTKDNFDIKNIEFKGFDSEKIVVDLFISEGLIIGYRVSDNIENIDLTTINIDNIWEKHFLNKDYEEIRVILDSLSQQELKKLNLAKNTFKICINNKEYYAIQDVGDGSYIVLNNEGIVFKATHDPFEIKKIYNSVQEYLNSIC